MLHCIRVDQVLRQPTVHSGSAGDGGRYWHAGARSGRARELRQRTAPRQRGAALLWGRRASSDGDDDGDDDGIRAPTGCGSSSGEFERAAATTNGDDELLRARAVILVVVRGTTAEAEAATQTLINLLLRQP